MPDGKTSIVNTKKIHWWKAFTWAKKLMFTTWILSSLPATIIPNTCTKPKLTGVPWTETMVVATVTRIHGSEVSNTQAVTIECLITGPSCFAIAWMDISGMIARVLTKPERIRGLFAIKDITQLAWKGADTMEWTQASSDAAKWSMPSRWQAQFLFPITTTRLMVDLPSEDLIISS